MWGRRILYLLVLLAAFLVYIFNTHYLAAFLFWMVLAAPVLSILLSLPALLTCRLELRCVPTDVVRGEEGRWEVALRGGGKLPLARVAFTLRLRRFLDGEEERLRRIYEGVSPGAVWTEEAEADHCQAVEGVLTAAWAADLLRLFALPLRRSPAVTMLVLPVSKAPASLPAAWGLLPAQAYAARTGQQLGEEYELRAFGMVGPAPWPGGSPCGPVGPPGDRGTADPSPHRPLLPVPVSGGTAEGPSAAGGAHRAGHSAEGPLAGGGGVPCAHRMGRGGGP